MYLPLTPKSSNVKSSAKLSYIMETSPVTIKPWCYLYHLALKHRETHGCVVSTAATDALVLKHQVISTLNGD